MRMRPVRLNAATASLFIVGSSCFVVGSVPAYSDAVGGVGDALTYFVGSIFFTSASYLQLLQAQNPAMTEVDESGQHAPEPVTLWRWLPQDRGWLAAVTQFAGTLFFNMSTLAALVQNASVQEQDRRVWRPDAVGSMLFLVSSVFGILVVASLRAGRPRSLPWAVAWLNMVGSVFFMASALASYVLPSTGDALAERLAVAGTLLGALCFLAGAVLMFPAWRRAVRQPGPLPAPAIDLEESE
ncbi:hypothetical protein ACIBSW_38550 [Actinoplanes sp. NPDC049668]|uniref:hypothetical protein n=1 Tax=unclassified Actinoplanes TaxID=2626549 RepID=UPI0033B90DFC